jgi:Ca-activated chloride channel family protein
MTATRAWSSRSFVHCRSAIGSALIVILLLLLPACKSRTSSDNESASSAPSADRLELVFTYGSEKEKWITEVTSQFNRENHRTASGTRIYVNATPLGSGEAIDEVMEGRRQPHIISPASAAFMS